MRAVLFVLVVCALGPCYGFILGNSRPSRVAATGVKASRSSPEETNLLAGTVVGGALVGLTAGGLLDGALANGDAPWSPILGCLLVGGGAFYAASETTGRPQVIATGLLGRPTLAAAASIKTAVLNQIESTRRAVNNKVDETVETVLGIPGAIAAKVEETIQNLVAEIKATPDKVAKAAVAKGDEVSTAIKDAVAKKVAEIQATPAKLSKAARNRVEVLVTDISLLPTKAADAVVKKQLDLQRSFDEKLDSLGLSVTEGNPVTVAKPAYVKTPVAATLAPSVPSPAQRLDGVPVKEKGSQIEPNNPFFGSLFGGASSKPVAVPSKLTSKPAAPAVPSKPITFTSKPAAPIAVPSKPITFTSKPAAPIAVPSKPITLTSKPAAPIAVPSKLTSKPATPSPSSASVKTTTLSSVAVKVLLLQGASSAAIESIDNEVADYLSGKTGPEGVLAKVKKACGRDNAFTSFPDVIGSLPRGDKKTYLNNWFQQQAV